MPRRLMLLAPVWALLLAAPPSGSALAAPSLAQDADLDLIPGDALTATGAPTAPIEDSALRLKASVEQALTGTRWRDDGTVAMPAARRPAWSHRLSADLRLETELAPDWSFTVADRLNWFAGAGRDLGGDDLANDLKEAYVTWKATPHVFLDAGRVNLRSGVAMGFNPTDVFKTDAVVTRVSEDPSVLRENRLGTVMARGLAVWPGGSATLAAAPDLRDGVVAAERSALDPGLDRTNARTRLLAKASLALTEDVAPELLVYQENGPGNDKAPAMGVNLTRAIGDRVVAYIEWSGQRRPGLAAQAIADAHRRRLLPDAAGNPITSDQEDRFRSQAAVGFSHTGDGKLTTNIELHYNEAGFTRGQWDEWFRAGPANQAGAAWLIRRFARERQEPVNRHTLFLRAHWPDAVMPDVDLTGLSQTSLSDGSTFAQLETAWRTADDLTLSLTIGGFLGGSRTEHGSQPQAASVMGKLLHFF